MRYNYELLAGDEHLVNEWDTMSGHDDSWAVVPDITFGGDREHELYLKSVGCSRHNTGFHLYWFCAVAGRPYYGQCGCNLFKHNIVPMRDGVMGVFTGQSDRYHFEAYGTRHYEAKMLLTVARRNDGRFDLTVTFTMPPPSTYVTYRDIISERKLGEFANFLDDTFKVYFLKQGFRHNTIDTMLFDCDLTQARENPDYRPVPAYRDDESTVYLYNPTKDIHHVAAYTGRNELLGKLPRGLAAIVSRLTAAGKEVIAERIGESRIRVILRESEWERPSSTSLEHLKVAERLLHKPDNNPITDPIKLMRALNGAALWD